jgi:predicted GNAT superfamily acetyltransferase
MTADRLTALAEHACYFRVIEQTGSVAAFLLAFRKGAPYDSPNFVWFDVRLDDFVYIDRVVIAAAFRGAGFATRLYDDLTAFARSCGVRRLTCEIDLEPPNPGSLAFHDKRGFCEIGRQRPEGAKLVSLRQISI